MTHGYTRYWMKYKGTSLYLAARGLIAQRESCITLTRPVAQPITLEEFFETTRQEYRSEWMDNFTPDQFELISYHVQSI